MSTETVNPLRRRPRTRSSRPARRSDRHAPGADDRTGGVRDRRHARDRRRDLPKLRRAGRGRRRRLRPRPRAGRGAASPSSRTTASTASIHQGNVGSAEDCRRTIDEVIERHGRLDVLVNNAGITIDKTVLKMTDEDWYKVIAVNLSGAFFMSQAVLPHMLERGTGPDHQHLLDHRLDREHRAGELRRLEVRAVRADQVAGARGLLPARAGRQAERGLDRADRERGGAGLHRHRDARGHAGEGPGAGQVPDPGGPFRPSGRRGARRALPRLGPLVVHHRRRVRRQRRSGHVVATARSRPGPGRGAPGGPAAAAASG